MLGKRSSTILVIMSENKPFKERESKNGTTIKVEQALPWDGERQCF